MSDVLRFTAKVQPSENGCLIWTGARAWGGYGTFSLTHNQSVYAHRFAYEQAHGPVPKGLTLDHLCRVRTCVNPAHLEPVTGRENTLRGNAPSAVNARKTHCLRGHTLTGTNVRLYRGWRLCRACNRDRMRKVRAQ